MLASVANRVFARAACRTPAAQTCPCRDSPPPSTRLRGLKTGWTTPCRFRGFSLLTITCLAGRLDGSGF